MNIAIVCPNFPPAKFEGGISHYSARLAENLMKRGHNVFGIASTEFSSTHSKCRNYCNVEIIRIKGPWNFFTIGEIRKAVKAYRLEALILQYAPADFRRSFRVRWGLSRFYCQKVTAFHTLWGKGFDRLLGLLVLFGSLKIIATNSEILDIFSRKLPFLLKKTYWIPIASAIDPIQGQVAKAKPASTVISYFGFLYPGKGLYLILDILENLKKRGHYLKFIFIGGWIIFDKSYETKFRKEITKRGLDNMVEILGMIPGEEVTQWLEISRFVFLPYKRGLSDRRSSFMTALAHGKAILTSPPVVYMPKFENGINVIWPETPDLLNYLELFELMLENDRLIGLLESNAKKLSQNFNWNKIAENYETALICDHEK